MDRGGIEKDFEYAMLTDEIYKTWSGMTSRENKNIKREVPVLEYKNNQLEKRK